MPKFVGSRIAGSIHDLPDNFVPKGTRFVELTHSQASLAARNGIQIHASMNTTDRGGKGSYAKRWYDWFADKSEIARFVGATQAMAVRVARAGGGGSKARAIHGGGGAVSDRATQKRLERAARVTGERAIADDWEASRQKTKRWHETAVESNAEAAVAWRRLAGASAPKGDLHALALHYAADHEQRATKHRAALRTAR